MISAPDEAVLRVDDERTQPPAPSGFRLLANSSVGLVVLAIFSALVVSSIFILIADTEVISAWGHFFSAPGTAIRLSVGQLTSAYAAMFEGAIGNPGEMIAGMRAWILEGDNALLVYALDSLDRSLVNTIPYIFAGLAVALGFRCGLFNIGVEGQLFMGALASAWIGYTFELPFIIHLPLALLAGALAGGFWAGIAGALKAWTGAHEVVTTIMLNYVAFRLSDYLLTGPMKRPGFVPVTPMVEETSRLPGLLPAPLRLHAGLLLALLVALLVYWLLFKTTIGFEIRTVGANPNAARYAGMSVSRNFILAMFLSGALAGLAGSSEVLGVNYFMAQAFSSGYGFDSIALALLGKSHPAGVVMAASLWGSLRAGATRMQSIASIPIDIIQIVQGMVIVFVAAPAVVRWIYRIRAKREGGQVIFTRGWGQ